MVNQAAPRTARVLWALLVLGSLYLLGVGLGHTFYIENTEAALTEARSGTSQIYLASSLLVVAGVGSRGLFLSRWVAYAVILPAVVCGGLTFVAPETLFPHLAFLVVCPVGIGGAVGGLLPGRRKRRRSGSGGRQPRPWSDAESTSRR